MIEGITCEAPFVRGGEHPHLEGLWAVRVRNTLVGRTGAKAWHRIHHWLDNNVATPPLVHASGSYSFEDQTDAVLFYLAFR